MFLQANYRDKDGKDHTYWSLVGTVRLPDGPCRRALCYLGELNDSAQARWLKVIEVFDEEGERRQLKLFPYSSFTYLPLSSSFTFSLPLPARSCACVAPTS